MAQTVSGGPSPTPSQLPAGNPPPTLLVEPKASTTTFSLHQNHRNVLVEPKGPTTAFWRQQKTVRTVPVMSMRTVRAAVPAVAAAVVLLAACDEQSGAPPSTTTASTVATPTTATAASTATTVAGMATTTAPMAEASSTTTAELGPEGLADCEVVLGAIAEVVQHPDTAEAVNADPALADEPASREAFDAVAVRFGALELRDPTVAAAAALVGERALDVALAEGTATGLVEPYAESFVALSDLCAAAADLPAD